MSSEILILPRYRVAFLILERLAAEIPMATPLPIGGDAWCRAMDIIAEEIHRHRMSITAHPSLATVEPNGQLMTLRDPCGHEIRLSYDEALQMIDDIRAALSAMPVRITDAQDTPRIASPAPPATALAAPTATS